MEKITDFLSGYENTTFVHYSDADDLPNTVAYDDLKGRDVTGVLKASRHVGGRLMQTYTEQESHVGVIAATRLGKTTSYVIPTVLSFARQRTKRSMIISDPKGEIYRYTAETLRSEGYRIILLNFRDYLHSECWNPLTPIYRKYQSVFSVCDQVELVETPSGPRNKFRGQIYEDQRKLENAIERWKYLLMEEVGNDIDNISMMIVPATEAKDPYWNESARELLKGYLWAMLEDSRPENLKDSGRQQMTEDTFSLATILTLMGTLESSDGSFDDGYFFSRDKSSRAYQIIKTTIPDNAKTTRQCIISVFNSIISVFRECAMRLVTSCNSFEMSVLTGDEPVALFINYRDELKVHFKVISLFVQDAYRLLIEHANRQPDGKRKVPFYFILDEFGNFPAMNDFDTTISACAGRNIFFILIMQSYAQLNNVYGTDVAEIIRDNLNMHVFFGSNNPATLQEFSKECGEHTRISPLSALNGKGAEIDNYTLETIALVPKSMLAHLEPGECIVTEANCGYVLYSRLERYYLCGEFNHLPLADEGEYISPIDPLDRRYVYTPSSKKRGRNFNFDF